MPRMPVAADFNVPAREVIKVARRRYYKAVAGSATVTRQSTLVYTHACLGGYPRDTGGFSVHAQFAASEELARLNLPRFEHAAWRTVAPTEEITEREFQVLRDRERRGR
jgi:hypothetical protein